MAKLKARIIGLRFFSFRSFCFFIGWLVISSWIFPWKVSGEMGEVSIFKAGEDYKSWPCLFFQPPRLISDGKIAKSLLDGLAELDKKGVPSEAQKQMESILQAFPDLKREYFEQELLDWNLGPVNFDGQEPIDYALFLRERGSLGGYSWVVVLRNERKVVYQELNGFYRGLNNIIGRTTSIRMKPSDRKSREDQISRFLEEAGISHNPSDLDGDGLADLIVHNQFGDCPFKNEEQDLIQKGLDPCGSMADLIDFPVPYFWDANLNRLACGGPKAETYYRRLKGLLHLIDPHDAKAIESELKRLPMDRLSK